MLLVVNPTQDLPGAEEEGNRILSMAGRHQSIHAGHAYFDEANRSQSGILCAGDQVLSGRDLATLDSLPSLVVFNACESARVRSATLPTRMSAPRANAKSQTAPLDELVDRNVLLAEAFFLRCRSMSRPTRSGP